MTTQTTKVKNGQIKIVLPRELRRSWRDADIFVFPTEDTLLLKKIQKPKNIFDKEIGKKLRALGRKITEKDIKDAILWARVMKR